MTDVYGDDGADGSGTGPQAQGPYPVIGGDGLLDPSTFPTRGPDDARATPTSPPPDSTSPDGDVHAEVLRDILAAQAKLPPIQVLPNDPVISVGPSLDSLPPEITGPLDTDTHAGVLRDIQNAQSQLSPASPRSVYSLAGGVVSGVGWQHPNDHGAGMGWRVYVTEPDGSRTGYGHMDPSSTPSVGQRLQQGDLLGQYASPTNGHSSAPHVHVQRYDPQGNIVDPGTASPLRGRFSMGSGFGKKGPMHPQGHQGVDWSVSP